MSIERIPSYPTLAFASRRDHELWLEQQAKAIEQDPPAELMSKDALKALKLSANETKTLFETMFADDGAQRTPAQKLYQIWSYVNASAENLADFQALLQTLRG